MTKAIEARKKYSMNQWAAIIKEQRESGKSVREFCIEHDLSWHAYYYWLHKIRQSLLDIESANSATLPDFIEIPSPDTTSDARTYDEGSITVHIDNVKIELHGNVSNASFRSVIQILKEVSQ